MYSYSDAVLWDSIGVIPTESADGIETRNIGLVLLL